MAVAVGTNRFGDLLRGWRARRRLSQMNLALDAGISQRHLSFVEIGRSRPSRDLVMLLASKLEVPLRERNALLLAAGFAPIYTETPLESAELLPVRHALQRILSNHEPYPAFVVDRAWNVVLSNEPVRRIFADGVAPELLAPRPNAIRACLHPDGLAPAIVNLTEYAPHLLANLERDAAVTPDHPVAALYDEVSRYPTVAGIRRHDSNPAPGLFVPLRLRALGGQELALISTIATFGTARDLTVADLSIESFFPADRATDAVLRSTFA